MSKMIRTTMNDMILLGSQRITSKEPLFMDYSKPCTMECKCFMNHIMAFNFNHFLGTSEKITDLFLRGKPWILSQLMGKVNTMFDFRVFWVIAFASGGFLASYFISALWDKWKVVIFSAIRWYWMQFLFRNTSPVYVSVATTSYPIPNIPFPAVSICSVNKLQQTRLDRALDGIKDDKDE